MHGKLCYSDIVQELDGTDCPAVTDRYRICGMQTFMAYAG